MLKSFRNVFQSLAIAGLIGIAGVACAAPTEIDTTKASLPSADMVKPAAAPEALAPHRALYNVKLGATRNGGHVSGITGRMFFSIADDCHDWNIEQKMQVRFYYSEGEVSDNLSDLISREAKDGSSYYFYSRRKSDKDAAEVVRGEANLTPDANGAGIGKAVYKGDAEKLVAFKAATLFPVHHTMELLKQARAGKKFFSTDVFDGADDVGYNQISAFIGETVKGDSGKTTPAKAESKDAATDALTGRQGWPIRMAFFSPDNERGSPDYEMDMLLLDNGVIKTMRVDYGDFSMLAELTKAEPLPAAKCTAKPLPPS